MNAAPSYPPCPECVQGKHQNCAHLAVDPATDDLVSCGCEDRGHREPSTEKGRITCCCCGRPATEADPRTDGGRMHFDCWNEHHSDPTEVWPPDHQCVDGVER